MHFRVVITDKVTPTLKYKQNKQSNTAKRSFFRKQATVVQGAAEAGFFRNLRIFEEDKQAGCKNTPTPSSRAVCQHGVAIHSLESSFAKVDSRNALFANAKSMDCHADKSARNDSELDSSVDCHATASAVSRNDNKNAVFQKVDSRENATNLSNSHAEAKLDSSKSPSDSKILELESGLFEPHKENKTRGLLTQCGDEIHDSSPKAESPLDKVAYAA